MAYKRLSKVMPASEVEPVSTWSQIACFSILIDPIFLLSVDTRSASGKGFESREGS